MKKRANEIAEIIKSSDNIHIVTHIDADGITAGSIAFKTLERLGKDASIEFVTQIDENVMKHLNSEQYDLVWFTDLGSSISNEYPEINKIITDHHECPKDSNKNFHLNPHLFNLDGGFEISGAGVTYLVSKAVDKKNMDLSALAIVGACGDLQDRRHGKLVGLNRDILNDGEKIGVINSKMDIRYFGRETRSIVKLLQFANDPIIPGITGREQAIISFLQEIGIRVQDGDNYRRWIDLNKSERQLIVSNIAQLILMKGFGEKNAKRILGEVYILNNEEEGSEVREAKEFATLLNSTARYGKCEVGLQVCLGDRLKMLDEARSLLRGHRANLVEGLQFVRGEGISKREFLQFFHAGTGVRDTIVGIITNMLLNSEDVSNEIPVIGFADKGNGEIKVSGRGTQGQVDRGLNLSHAMKKAAKIFDGVGGGHSIAAGATIPKGKEEEFLEILEREIKSQLS